MLGNSYQKKLPSRLPQVRETVNDVTDFIKSNFPNVRNDDMYDLRLIFSELLINAVIHGNHNDEKKYVQLQIDLMPDHLIVAYISDEGAGFDYRHLLRKVPQDCFLMEESGRGIQLVYSLTDGLSFLGQGNKIQFMKKVRDA